MPRLSEIQAAFSDAVLRGETRGLARMISPDLAEPLTRISVYRDNVLGGAISALRLAYPTVRALVGDDFFNQAAMSFALGFPPRCAVMAEWGDGFGDFLRDHPGCAHLAWLRCVARLDWAMEQALHAPDVTALTIENLTGFPFWDLANVRLRLHPSLTLLELDCPADAIRRAVIAGGEGLERIQWPDRQLHFAVVRHGETIEIRAIEPSAWNFLRKLGDEEPLGFAANGVVPADLGRLLADLFALGCFVRSGDPNQYEETL